MARAPFSIEWLSQSSCDSLAPCSSPGTFSPLTGCFTGQRINQHPQVFNPNHVFASVTGRKADLCEEHHGTNKEEQHTQKDQMMPKSCPSAGGDSGYESEAGRSECVTPQRDSRRCPSLSPLVSPTPLKDSRGCPLDWPSHHENHMSCRSDFATHHQEEDSSLYTTDAAAHHQEEDSRMCPSDSVAHHKDGRHCPSSRATHQEEDISLYPSDCRTHQKGDISPYFSDCASHQEDISPYPSDHTSHQEEDISPYPSDHTSHQEEDISPYPSDHTSHQEEDSSIYPSGCATHQDSRLGRRLRTAFSSEQICALEKTFKRHKYLGASERRKLATRLQLSEVQLKTWFQNRRMKMKRQLQDMRPDAFAPAPYFNALHFGQTTYAPFLHYGHPAQLPPAGLAYPAMVPSLYPLDSAMGFLQPQPLVRHSGVYSGPAALASY